MLSDEPVEEDRVGDRDLTRWRTPAGRFVADRAARLGAHLSAHAIFYLITAIGLGVVVGLTAGFAGVYDAVTEHDGVAGLDQPVLDFAVTHRAPDLTALINGFTQLGGPIGMPVIAGVIVIVMAWRWRSRTPVVLMIIGAAGALLMTTVGKAIVGRARPALSEAVPPYEYAFSFPSGHALNSTVIAGLVAYLLLRRQRSRRARVITVVLAVLWAVAMGLSRVYLGHHWLTDVMAAWALGAAWLALIITSHRLYLTLRHRRSGSARND